jgi:aryl-alcohol dehydrogenase-like predicted oxidoreductase
MRLVTVGSIRASVIGLGCNQFGPTCDAEQTQRVVRAALDAGISFFDVADEYGPDGVAEEYLGRALVGRRDEAVIATKFGSRLRGDPATGGAGARWIARAAEDSLRRLGTDRIDLYQQHFPDTRVPQEETLTALDRLVRDGKVRAMGVCNMAPEVIEQRLSIARRGGLPRPASVQDRYNLLRQEAAAELLPCARRLGLAFLPFFPLASGMLGGRYQQGQPPPADSRFGRHLEPAHARHIIDRDAARVARLAAWAAEHGRGVAELAVAWLASQPGVGPVIAGATWPGRPRPTPQPPPGGSPTMRYITWRPSPGATSQRADIRTC